ncbi:penicillin acylase family protein [Patulibacter sp.]|uniref:penicillin acylase family protein n=1 Tax=Patulibacter sp. TaxID=1912859 RepID=UPI0027252D7E|nr:penicillin acylase family protein [Patulibacter sp.]MDO9408246.1 penicillin acylase family protein [Patulibacter sp.]
MKRPSGVRPTLAGLATIVLCAVAAPPAVAADRYDVTVARTEYGIPHIKAKDFASLGYGYAQALAEDDVCTVAETYVTVGAERSRWFGADKTYELRGNGSRAKNLNSDFFFQRINDRGTVERLAAVPPPIGPKDEIRQAVRGYVAGWNTWLKGKGGTAGIPDPTCRGKGWVRPITEIDVYRRFHQLAILASSSVAIDGIAEAQPLTGPVDAQAAARSVAPGELDRRLGGLGSNAYAIGKTASRSGRGLLYGNPHFPWQDSERFYQAHLTVPGKLDVTGGSLLGVPIVLIGTTKGMAWSHTVSTARRFVPYQLQLVPGQPTKYVEDGKVKDMRADRVTVRVPGAGGRLEPRTRTLYSSEQGPIFTSLLGLSLFPWSPVNAYAMLDGNDDNFGRLMNHFFEMDQAQSTQDVEAVLKRYQGIPWVNTIAADTAGNAYYADIGTVPNVSAAKYGDCQTPLGRTTDLLQRLPILDGSRTACRPGNDPDAVVPGILGPKNLPSLRRDDHVSNMNDSYWLTNPDKPLEGFSRIIGDERTARSLRTRLGVKQLQERVAGTDGLPGKGFDLENLMQVGMGNRVYSAEIWRDALVAGCDSEACRVLRGWDLHNDLDSKGAVLWQRFVERLGVVLPGIVTGLPVVTNVVGPFATPFDPARPVDTPGGLNRLTPTVPIALNQAVADLQAAGLPLDATLRRGQTVTRRGETIPIPGGPGPSGIFNVITPTWNPKKGYTEVVHGSSFVQAVDLKPGCPDVRTILTYGQSTNPASVHSSDQTKLFSQKRWVTAPFCEKDLEADRSADRIHTAEDGSTLVTVHEARGKGRPRVDVTRASGKPARVTVKVRRGKRLVRTVVRRGAAVTTSPTVKRGAYRIDVTVGKRTLRVTAKQR